MRNHTIGQSLASFGPLSKMKLLKWNLSLQFLSVGLTENINSLMLLMSLEVCCGEAQKGRGESYGSFGVDEIFPCDELDLVCFVGSLIGL
jgi:hypothetical protein